MYNVCYLQYNYAGEPLKAKCSLLEFFYPFLFLLIFSLTLQMIGEQNWQHPPRWHSWLSPRNVDLAKLEKQGSSVPDCA